MSDQTSPTTDTDKPVELHFPSEWMALCPKIPQRLVKLGCALAGLDPTEEDAEPIDRVQFDALVQAARDKLVQVKQDQQSKGVNPLRVSVFGYGSGAGESGCMHAIIVVAPDAATLAAERVQVDDGRPPDHVEMNNATSFWATRVAWPQIGSHDLEMLQHRYPGMWFAYPKLHRSDLYGALKKRG